MMLTCRGLINLVVGLRLTRQLQVYEWVTQTWGLRKTGIAPCQQLSNFAISTFAYVQV